MVSKKRYKSPAKRVRHKLKPKGRAFNCRSNAKAPLDVSSDGVDIPDDVELQGVDLRGCSLVAVLAIVIACGFLAAVHIVVLLLV